MTARTNTVLHSLAQVSRRPAQVPRHGISLLEVIACIAILSIVLVPLSSMLHSSSRQFVVARGLDTDSQTRNTLRWLRGELKAAQSINRITAREIEYVDSNGRLQRLRSQSRVLGLEDGSTVTPILENVVRFACEPLPSGAVAPFDALRMVVEVTDSQSQSTEQTVWVVK
ncbi:MAG: prepilin-type N-terminal cleavage/methylation domain-containing protein [Planctomycetota bacterium]